jgi:NitT/TauT family transport system substrate-binding protein
MSLHRRSILLSGLAASTLAACSKPAPPPKAAAVTASPIPAPPPGAVKIRFATDWRAEAEHGGFYQALATGEYQKRGLDVTITPGGPGVSVPTLLATGGVDLGIGSNSFGVMNLARQRVPVKAVMATMQKDPQVLLAHPDSGIKSIADMRNHPMLIGDEAVTSFWLWLKAKYGFTDDMVRKYTFNAGPFIANKDAVQEGYVSSEPYTVEKQAGFKPEVFLLADNGYPGYAGMVLAPDKLIAADPRSVKAFVDATAAGWTAYLHGDPKPADALILRDNPDMKQDVLDQARDKFRDYAIFEQPGTSLGAMTDAKWRTFFETASSLGVYGRDLNWKAAYTLKFLPQAA